MKTTTKLIRGSRYLSVKVRGDGKIKRPWWWPKSEGDPVEAGDLKDELVPYGSG